MRRGPIPGSPATRTADEARIVELLMLQGWAFERSAAARRASEAAARAALQRLVEGGLPVRIDAGARKFDPGEVVCALAWSGIAGTDPPLAERRLANGRALAWQTTGLAPDLAAPPPLKPARPRAFRVSLQRRFSLSGVAPGRRLRLRLPAPIADERLKVLTTRLSPPSDIACETRTGPAAVEAVLAAPEADEVTFGATFEIAARPWLPSAPAEALSVGERELYTRHDEGLIKVSPRIVELAAGSRAETPLDLVRRVWTLLMDDMSCGPAPYEALDPRRPLDWVLDHGWFDCRLGAALIAAVCRARGVPARLAGGFTLGAAAPFAHYWAEVWLEDRGWTPFDLLGWDLSLGGRDAAWSDHLFGRLDHRMTTQRLPRLFHNAGSIRLPRAWRLLARAAGSGVETDLRDAETGDAVYSERVEVEPMD